MQGSKNANKQVKISEMTAEKKRKMMKDDEINYFDNQDTSRNDEDGKGNSNK